MKRCFSLISLVLIGLSGCVTSTIMTPSIEGFKYLPHAHDSSISSEKIEVLVFFGYQCPHCFNFYERELLEWMSSVPVYVDVKLVPVIWSSSVIPAARVFHTAQVLNANPIFHHALFAAYQSNREGLSTPESFSYFAELCCDIEPSVFKRVYQSSKVSDLMVWSEQVIMKYNVQETPSLVVSGKYYVSPDTAPSYSRMIEVVNELIEFERQVALSK